MGGKCEIRSGLELNMWRFLLHLLYKIKNMTRILIAFLMLLTACGGGKKVDHLLEEVWNKDQAVRHKMAELTKAVTIDGCIEKVDSLLIINELKDRIDAENVEIVEKVLLNGLPKNLSRNSYRTIWGVIDHSPLPTQERYLPIVKQMAEGGLIEADEYAILLDRIAMRRGRLQRFGSQVVQYGTPGEIYAYVYPIENPEILDSLRTSVGLLPMAEYLDQVSTIIGVDVKYDPTLTIEKLEKLQNQ